MKFKILTGVVGFMLVCMVLDFVVLHDWQTYARQKESELVQLRVAVNDDYNQLNKKIYKLKDKLKERPDYSKLQAMTVRVDVGMGCGTGVLVTRQVGEVRRTFVWTAGHVVKHLRNEDGTFSNATIYQEWREDEKYRCSTRTPAKVIAYSDPESGDDLAVLEVLQDNFSPESVSAIFADGAFPVGTELVHVGCTLGLYASVSRGIISQTDRDLLKTGKMFDQTSCMGYPGSSGGGVYTVDGQCVGLLVRGAGAGLNFIVPTRRMQEWAKKMKIEWALSPNMRVPTHWNMREPTPLTDGTEETEVEPMSPGPDSFIESIREIIRAIVAGVSRDHYQGVI